MSYQEIYQGLNKKASAEQVKQLAAVIGMRKRAALQFAPVLYGANTGRGPSRILNAIFKNFGTVSRGNTLPSADPSFLRRMGVGTLKYGLPAAGLFGGGLALGNMGKSDLKATLDRANATNTKLTEQNKKLQNRGIWDMILQNWDKFSKWFADLFKGEPNKQPITQGTK